jgi:hypothetical protein
MRLSCSSTWVEIAGGLAVVAFCDLRGALRSKNAKGEVGGTA